jgi:autotransporter translocation and assembly factor TamB
MRRRTKGLIYLAVIICVLILGTLIVFRTQGERIAIKLGDFLTTRVGRDRNLDIEIGNISGSIVRDLVLEDVLVTYTGGETPTILLSVSSVYAKVNLPALLLGRVEIDSLAIRSPNLVIPTRPDGSRIYLSGDSKGGPPGKPFNMKIDRFAVADASVNWQGQKPHRISRLDVAGSIASRNGGFRVTLDNANLRYGRTLTVTELAGTVEVGEDAVKIENMSIGTSGSRVGVTGRVGRGENDSVNVAVVVDSLGLQEIPTFTDGDPKPGLGKLSGRIEVGGTLSDLVLGLDLEGDILGWPLEDLSASLTYHDRAVDLERLSALFNGVAVDLSCEYALSDPPTYKGIVAFTDLDLSRFAPDESPALASDLNGSVRFSGRGTTVESFNLSTWPHLDAGRYRDWRFDWVHGKVEVTAARVVLDSVRAGVAGAEAVADGRIDYDGQVDLEFVYDVGSLKTLSTYHKRDDLDGSIRGRAHLTSGAAGLDLDAETSGSGLDFRGARVESLTVKVTLAESGGGLHGEGHLLGRDVDIMGVKGLELIGDVTLRDRTVDIERLALTRPDGSLFGLVGTLDIEERGFEMVLTNLFVEMAGLIWENDGDVQVSYRGDSLAVSQLALVSKMGRISVQRATYDGNMYSLNSAVEGFDLGRLKSVTGKEIPSGTLDLTLAASGTADSLTFRLDFHVRDGEVRSIDFESLAGTVSYDGRRVDLKELNLRQNGGMVSINGWIPMDLSPTRVRKALASGNGYDLIDDLGEISIRVSDIDIALIQPLVPPASKLRGFANLSLEIDGKRQSPRVVSVGSLRDAVFGEIRLGSVAWDIALEDSALHIRSLTFGQGAESGRVSGNLPLAVSILPFSSRLTEESWDLDIRVDKGNLGLLCEVLPKLKVCSGTYAVNLKVGGTVADPTFNGKVSLSGARLRVEGVAQDIRDLYLDVSAEGKRFKITKMVAEGGAVKAGGFFELVGKRASKWDVAVDLNHYRVTEFEDFYAQLKGRLEVKSDSIAPGLPVPMIQGDLVVEEGEYYYAGTRETGGGDIIPPTPTPGWLLDVTVDLPNDFWIRGDLVNAELQGDLNVRRGKEGLTVLGTLQTIRGSFNLYHNSFRITKGEFRFSDVKSFWNAYIDLEAVTTVLDERIQITATGRIDELNVAATSESGWNEQQIFEALLLRRGVVPAEGEQPGFVSQAFVRSWATALVSQFGDQVARELHLDRFGVEIGESTQGSALSGTRVTIGKYLSEKFYFELSQSLGTLYGDRQRFTQTGLSYPERQLSVEYRFNEKLSIEGETGTIGGLGYFQVDLKLRYGY